MKLWHKLFGSKVPPTLVIPVPEIGPDKAVEPISDEDFLFGMEKRFDTRVIMRLPLDPVVAGAMYKGVRPPREGEVRPTVSYDPEKATDTLLRQAIGHRPRSVIGQERNHNVTK